MIRSCQLSCARTLNEAHFALPWSPWFQDPTEDFIRENGHMDLEILESIPSAFSFLLASVN